jgi:hypothetical protein
MKLFVTISFIASVISIINGNNIPKPANHNQDMESIFTDSLVTNTKQCYKCDFAIDNFIDTNTLLNDKCTNKTINCDNAFCSTILSKNKHYSKYTMQLGCISKNYCPKITEKNTQYPEVITDNYINCCDDNLCNDGTTINNVLPFYLEKNNKYFINDGSLEKQTINYKNVDHNILHDFSFANDQLDNSCIHELFFTKQDNLIITLKKNDCNNNLIGIIPKDSLPAFPSQPIEKIIFLDKNNKTITNLISSNTGITSINYISDKNLLFFIADDNIFVYKLDKNKQLRKISQLYLNKNPIDIAINYNAKVLAVTNKNTVYFYNIENIEKTKQFISIGKQLSKQVGESNIYKLQYTPNRDTILVKSYDANHIYTDLYNLENFNNITYINKNGKQKIDKRHNSIENIKYNLYKLDFYYGKSAISPIDNLIVTREAINRGYYGTGYFRNEFFYAYLWHHQNNTDSYSTTYTKYTNPTGLFSLEMLNPSEYNQHEYNTKDKFYRFNNHIVNILDYFFITDKKPIMAFITLRSKGKKYLFLRQVPGLEQPSGAYYDWKQYIKENPKLITFKKIFDSARSGLFNKNSSKIAIFGNNRIQIHAMHLDQNKLPEIKTSVNKINSTNLNNDKKSHNNFLDKFNTFIKENPYKITAAATALFTSIVIISCIIKHKKSNKKSKQKTIDDKKNFLSMDLKTPFSYQNKAMSIDSQEINEQNKTTDIDSQEINKKNKATDIDIKDNAINKQENQYIDFNHSNMQEIILNTDN